MSLALANASKHSFRLPSRSRFGPRENRQDLNPALLFGALDRFPGRPVLKLSRYGLRGRADEDRLAFPVFGSELRNSANCPGQTPALAVATRSIDAPAILGGHRPRARRTKPHRASK